MCLWMPCFILFYWHVLLKTCSYFLADAVQVWPMRLLKKLSWILYSWYLLNPVQLDVEPDVPLLGSDPSCFLLLLSFLRCWYMTYSLARGSMVEDVGRPWYWSIMRVSRLSLPAWRSRKKWAAMKIFCHQLETLTKVDAWSFWKRSEGRV